MVGSVELWREADAVLDRLLDLEPGEREAALAAMPLSRDLRETVARLLAAHRDESGVLDRAVHEAPTSALRGRRLGRWELEHEIGRGGMAVVYRAHAIDAPTQVAAVKLLTLGALGRGVERFQQEQAVLARLRHPHIATLFDSGTAPDGTPWLAMALVDGVRIDAWCERRALAPREIVRLFLDVCDAVAHAHRNLVIHRDLKPSNVLVDHDGHVRLLDFGIARLADEQGEATATQWRALTPEYAAPEQFDGAPPSTAMDVHGLGALLYRLLVGTSPRSGATARDADVTTPSRALRDARRASVMRGDLDAVLVKALARDPQRRYESVGALQRDLVAWLERRPVAARTPSLGYRLSRFVARNRLAVAATTAIALAILVGAALALWQAQRANAQSELAQRNAARATSVRDFLVSLFESADPEREGGAVASTREIVALGAERARSELAADPALRAEMLRVIGAIQRRLGATDDAAATLDAASDAARAAGAALPAVESAQLGYERGVLQSIAGDLDAAERSFEGIAGLLASDEGAAAGVLRAQALGELVVVAQGRGDLDAAFARLADAEAAVARLEPPNPYERMVVRNLRVAVLNDAGRYAE
ncbi:MAG TPA: serine/threonine-protein kinase, partial [Xanthomonadales bacterium]|nr:serine/threonine-protein kinase [Xanthomonadales bacterium]